MSAQYDPNQRLLAIIDEQRKLQTPEELLQFVIQLYGAEFIKANDEIARLREANDNLFKIKQKVVIANRELMQTLEGALKLREILREIYVRHQNLKIKLPLDICGMIVNAIGAGT